MWNFGKYAPLSAITFGLAAGVFSDAIAQSADYGKWNDPNAPAAKSDATVNTQKLVDELNRLIDQADRAQAADPQFLQDLRALSRRYGFSWRTSLLTDNFEDGDFTSNPKWVVSKGTFWVEKGFGLRASFDQTNQSKEKSSGRKDKSSDGGDLAGQLLGALLSQALNGSNSGSSAKQASPPATTAPEAVIYVDKPISNAFAIELELTSWRENGRLEIGTFQGAARVPGYRLIYRSGISPALEMVRVSNRGSSVIEAATNVAKLEDKKIHKILWTRNKFGEMIVRIDGIQFISATDRGFRDPFGGFKWINHGGDYILRRIRIDGTS